jgi:protein import protein ZIM17
LCCQKRPQPSWRSSALYQQKRQFTSKPGDTDDGNIESVKPEDDNSNNAVTASEDVTKDLVIPGAQKGGKKLAIIFTCTVCDTRAAKQFTENAYQRGVVIVTCPGCNNRHLIADNLGFFPDEEDGEDGWNIEKGMAKLGQNVKMVNNDSVLELSVDDIYGKEYLEKALEAEAEENSDEKSYKS